MGPGACASALVRRSAEGLLVQLEQQSEIFEIGLELSDPLPS
jgi:hypothetical protein